MSVRLSAPPPKSFEGPLKSARDAIKTAEKLRKSGEETNGSEVLAANTTYYLRAEGASDRAIKTLRALVAHPKIDPRWTVTNNLHEIRDVLGIDALRTAVTRELHAIMTSVGRTINTRHYDLIGMILTLNSNMMPFTGRGSRGQGAGAYSESSFDKALPAFMRSALASAQESTAPVSTSVLLGRLIPVGTSFTRVRPSNTGLTGARAESAPQAPAESAPALDSLGDPLSGVNVRKLLFPPARSSALGAKTLLETALGGAPWAPAEPFLD